MPTAGARGPGNDVEGHGSPSLRVLNWKFYVYALSAVKDGVSVVFYVGGAYGNANRMNIHSATHGAKHAQKFISKNPDLKVLREVYAYCVNRSTTRVLERTAWHAFRNEGHPVQEEPPWDFPEEARAEGLRKSHLIIAQRRRDDPKFSAALSTKAARTLRRRYQIEPEFKRKQQEIALRASAAAASPTSSRQRENSRQATLKIRREDPAWSIWRSAGQQRRRNQEKC